MNATERQSFLEARQKGIGSSDVAPILGLSPWKSALDVYLDKVQPIAPKKMAPHLEWGLRHEPSMAAAIMDHYGWTLHKTVTISHADYPFLLSSADRENQDGEICELKTSRNGEGFGAPDTDEVPDYYWMQCQHQMACRASHGWTGDKCWLFVLIGGSDFRRYRIPRDDGYLPTVIDSLVSFWNAVENRTPPEPDWQHESTIDAVKRLFQPKPGTSTRLDVNAKSLTDEYERFGAEIKAIETCREETKARLIAAIGEYEVGELDDGRSIVRKQVDRAGYTVEPKSYVDFRIKHPKKGK